MAPIEIVESEFPTRVERFELLADTGGAGFYRGGLGFIRDYRILADEVRFSMRTDKHIIAPQGKNGGREGRRGACVINPGGKDEQALPSRFGDYVLKKDDLLRLERPGGGGMGDPFGRDPEKVWDDVRQGYVSVEKAMSEYRVALRAERGEVGLDLPQTQRLRNQ
jgi:N-methylhydantoinase B